MSSELSFNSKYGDESSRYTHNSNRSEDLYSHESDINLSDMKSGPDSEAEIIYSGEQKSVNLSKLGSMGSLISAADTRSINHGSIESLWNASNVSRNDHHKHLNKTPFVYDGTSIHYDKCINPNTPVLFGSTKLNGVNGECGYHPELFRYDPGSNTLSVGNIVVHDSLTVAGNNFSAKSIYLEGTGGITGIIHTILPEDDVNIIYANPIGGTINIYLGTGTNNLFAPNRTIQIKDSTLEFGPGSAYNVNILVHDVSTVPGAVPVRIEYYNGGLTAGTNAGYALNTSGGAVTFTYSQLPIPGNAPTWVINNQFIGNPRLIGTGVTFIPTNDNIKTRLINLK